MTAADLAPRSRRRGGHPALVAALALAAAEVLHAEPTLSEACRAALARSPELGQARAAAQGAAERIAGSRAALLPSLELLVGAQGIAALEQGTPRLRPDRQESVALRLEQTIFAGGSLWESSLEAREEALAAVHAQALRRQDVLHLAASLYYGVLQALQTQRQAEADLERSAAQALGARLKERAGLLARAEAEGAEAEQARAQAATREAAGRLAEARGKLERLTGLSFSAGLATPNPLPLPSGEIVTRAEEASPAVLSAQRSLEARRRGERAARGRLMPSLVAGGSLRRGAEFPRTLQFVREEAAGFIEARWALFSGGERLARLRQARSARREASERLREARDQAAVSALVAREQALSTQERVAALERQVSAAREAYEGVKSRHEAGLEPALALREAGASLTSAEAALLAARFGRERAALDAHLALGTVEKAVAAASP